MPIVRHKFREHRINPATTTLIVGTFNPEAADNPANFFYGRNRNYLWRILPTAFDEPDLKGAAANEKMRFIERRHIDFIDLISEIQVDDGQEANYDDAYIDNRVTEWSDVIAAIELLPALQRVCVTRKTFTDVPNMAQRVSEIRAHCERRQKAFATLVTPARYYSAAKQTEWTRFLLNGNG